MRADRRLVKTLTQKGWVVVRSRTHYVMRCPCGKHQTAIAGSLSDRRGLKNKRAELRRMRCPSLEGVM